MFVSLNFEHIYKNVPRSICKCICRKSATSKDHSTFHSNARGA